MQIVKLNKNDNNSTNIKYNHGIPYISFNALEKYTWLKHGFSTRYGGVSENELATMNLGFSRGDLEENVIKNHEIIADTIGFDAKNIVTSHQTHTTNVRLVTQDDCGKGIYVPRDYENIDALITNEKDVVLATYFADCVPLFIVDRKNKAIGLAHSGWKGTVNKIGLNTIEHMKQEFKTKPENIVACIGPSICKKCYEIGEDVAVHIKEAFPENYEEVLEEKHNGKYQLDLWKCNELIFLQAGVMKENIHITDLCTCCNLETLFSHRGHNKKRGNLAAFMTIL